ncbi:MAG: prolipoprotein diacylglyceryl transferase [Ruminococcaceae bacterium]|nr:prolipoprotein diacylglyceryl transferase [Oscillospiraceae bacterium]
MTYVSFPGLGIEPFHMERVAFSLFGIDVNWYGLIITCGMILAVAYAVRNAKTERVKSDDVIDLALYLIIFGIIGARLYYVIMEFDRYLVSDGTFLENLGKTLYNCVAVWNGGLAIYGGIIAGFLTALVYAKKKRIRFGVIADIAGPAVMVGQIIGRWGNFVNAEAFGSETTLPWRMGILKSMDGGESFYSEMFVHPTFLYESLWNLVGLIIITLIYKKKKFHGQMFISYMTWYGFGRMLIEGLRTDSLYVGNMRISQFVGFVTFIAGVILMIVNFRRVKEKKEESYTAVYAKAAGGDTTEKNVTEEEEENNGTKEESEKEKKDGSTD